MINRQNQEHKVARDDVRGVARPTHEATAEQVCQEQQRCEPATDAGKPNIRDVHLILELDVSNQIHGVFFFFFFLTNFIKALRPNKKVRMI